MRRVDRRRSGDRRRPLLDGASGSGMKVLLAFLKRFDPEVRDLALALREVVISEMRPCQEWICDVKYTVAIGYGPTEKVSDTIVTITSYTRHVNLAFNRGALLENPHGLLQGKGKLFRFIPMKT